MLEAIDWARITSLVIDNKHHHGYVSVKLSIRRDGGEGLQEAAVSGPIPVAEALKTAYEMADRGYQQRPKPSDD